MFLGRQLKAWPEKEIPAFKKMKWNYVAFFPEKGGMDMDPIYATPQIQHNSICKKLPSNVVNYWNTLIHYV